MHFFFLKLCLLLRGKFLYGNVLLKETKLLNHFIWFHLSSYAALVTTFNLEIGITGAILMKLDGDSRGGAALSVKEVCLHQFSLSYNIIVQHMAICPLKSYEFMSFHFSKPIWVRHHPTKVRLTCLSEAGQFSFAVHTAFFLLTLLSRPKFLL